MGGEKCNGQLLHGLLLGSPPHGRGKAVLGQCRQRCIGITPAWAGKSHPAMLTTSGGRDHPRMGGEKSFGSRRCGGPQGSPPHGRGKVAACGVRPSFSGITPAWAGKRLKRSHRSGIFISGPIPFHSVLHRPAGSGGSRAGRDGSPAGQPQNAGPA